MVFLKTDRLSLRNIDLKDAEEMFDYRNNEVCARYQRGQSKTLTRITELCESRKQDTLSLSSPAMIAVALKNTDQLIGEIVVQPHNRTIVLGYTFTYKLHRRGYAYEALSALIALLHESFPECDFVCMTDPENTPSMALLQKLGYDDLGYIESEGARAFGKWVRENTLKQLAKID